MKDNSHSLERVRVKLVKKYNLVKQGVQNPKVIHADIPFYSLNQLDLS